MTGTSSDIRLGADIGGTFTDIALDLSGRMFSTKVLTNYAAPEQAILDGIAIVARDAGIRHADIGIVIHGTTLATNALIARRGAKTALVTTEGFRDVIEMRTENRFEQYDLNLRLPSPLIPREHRFSVKGRISAEGGSFSRSMRTRSKRMGDAIRDGGFGAVAIGFIHAYANPAHERRARQILSRRLHVPISISAEVSPQMREFERFNTVCANAYVRPQMADYLARLQHRLRDMGAECPVFMIHSGGGLISVETASRVSRPPGRIRPGGGRHLRGRHCPPFRSRQGGVLRYGRHDGKDLPDRGLRAAHRAHLRGRAHLPFPQGLGDADLDPGHRDDRDRGRWRLDRLGRCDGTDPDRTGERRLGARTGLLQSRRRSPGDHRRRPGPRQARPAQFRWRRHQAER